MPVVHWPLTLFFLLCPALSLFPSLVHAGSPTFIPQSFYFDYDSPDQPVPIPVTRQCDTIHLKWRRGDATGPNPTAPYSLQIYTSTFVVPFIVDAGSDLKFDWAVPFAPGTMYQICMFDANGATGGCQATYTVIESGSASCTNITFPVALAVDAQVDNGPLSQFGWMDSYTDISVQPKNGTPPYIFTAAPALHPPFNVSSSSDGPFNWTVALSWASPFFVSVVDSKGSVWSQGPLHSGGSGKTACLDTDGTKSDESPSGHSTGVVVGAAATALSVGALVGAAAFWMWMHQPRKRRRFSMASEHHSLSNDTLSPQHYRRVNSDFSPNDAQATLLGRSGGSDYVIEPFTIPTAEDGTLQRRDTTNPSLNTLNRTVSSDQDRHDETSSLQGTRAPSETPTRAVYVVHHDGGRAPVTVYTHEGTEVVELPPQYIEGSNTSSRPRDRRIGSTDGRNEGQSDRQPAGQFLNPQRRPNRGTKSTAPS